MTDAATADVVDLGIERLVHIDARIDEREGEALRDRWEFGRELLARRVGKKLPTGLLGELTSKTNKSRQEIQFRVQFAERFPTEEALSNALDNHSSWFEITQKALKRAVEPVEPAEVHPVPEGQFATIVADPPWRYGNTSTRGAAEDHYPTMSIEELCELDFARERAADQAHLYLWTTAGHLPDAFKVVEAWGFEYKTYLVWVKPQMGMGNYFRVSTELVLFGTRGGLRTNDRATRNYFEARRAKHSSKPREFRELVKKVSFGPFLELFARCRREELLHGCECARCEDGWTVWGNQT